MLIDRRGLMGYPCCWSLFFFQAEDGIRDGHVTGVQTCALPISECFRLEQIAKQMLIDPPRLPHPPFDTVSLDGSAKFFFSNETDKTALVRIFVDPVSKLNGRGSLNLCFPAEEPVKIVSPAQNPAAGKGQFFLLLIR